MKKYSYSISIDNPCEQNLSEMSFSEKGKFCTHCSKEVIDFSKLTDKEIINIIENSQSKLCGSFNKTQLNRLLIDKEIQSSKPGLYKKILAGFLMLLSAGSANAQSTNSQTEIVTCIQNENSSLYSTNTDHPKEEPSDSLKNIIRGKILDSITKEPIPGAEIIIKGTSNGTVTDIDGSFELTISERSITDTISVSYIGYYTFEFSVYNKDYLLLKLFI